MTTTPIVTTTANRPPLHPFVLALETFSMPFVAFGWNGEILVKSEAAQKLLPMSNDYRALETKLRRMVEKELSSIRKRFQRQPFERVAEFASVGQLPRTELFISSDSSRRSNVAAIGLFREELSATNSGRCPPRVTPREAQVAHMIASGAAGKEIACAMDISEHTVRRHTEKLFAKLGVRSRAALTRQWVERLHGAGIDAVS